jgi:hypothetical protein
MECDPDHGVTPILETPILETPILSLLALYCNKPGGSCLTHYWHGGGCSTHQPQDLVLDSLDLGATIGAEEARPKTVGQVSLTNTGNWMGLAVS